MDIDDPWAELGLAPGADAAAIKAAWRRLVAQWHPDRNKAPNAHSKMQRINRAYEMLSSGEHSGHGDAESENARRPSDWWDSRWHDSSAGFGGRPGAHHQYEKSAPHWERGPGVKAPKPIQRTASLTIEEVMSGCQRSFKGSIQDLCPHCAGARIFTTLDAWCDECGGDGRVRDYWGQRGRRCKACDGTGDARRDCPKCGGRGLVEPARSWSVAVNIPVGALPGDVVVASGQGQRGADGDVSDLEIRIELKPHPLYTVDAQRRLCATVPVDIFTYMSRGHVEVPALGGGTARFDLAQGTMQELPGLGLPDRAGKRGPLVLRATPVVPRELSERERLYLYSLASGQQDDGYERCTEVADWRARAAAYQRAASAAEAEQAKGARKGPGGKRRKTAS